MDFFQRIHLHRSQQDRILGLGSIGKGIKLIVRSDCNARIWEEVLELVLEVDLGIGDVW
jgi:hypothetical protein